MEKKPIIQEKLTVIKNQTIAPLVIELSLEKPEQFTFAPGQYISFVCDTKEKRLRRPYSIVSIPQDNQLDFCIKILNPGNLTPYLATLKEGDMLSCIGPLGTFTLDENYKDHDLIFLSHGVGIAPLKAMIMHLLKEGFTKNITLLTGYRNKEDILYDEIFKDLQKKYPTFSYHNILSNDPDEQKRGRVQALVKRHINKNAQYYLCGLKEMIASVRNLLYKEGVPMPHIFSEKFD